MGEAADDHINWLINCDYDALVDDWYDYLDPYDPVGGPFYGASYYQRLAAHIKSGGVSRDALALGMKFKAAGLVK